MAFLTIEWFKDMSYTSYTDMHAKRHSPRLIPVNLLIESIIEKKNLSIKSVNAQHVAKYSQNENQ